MRCRRGAEAKEEAQAAVPVLQEEKEGEEGVLGKWLVNFMYVQRPSAIWKT